MTYAERRARFVDRLQAIECPVCRRLMEVRRSTWENAERKMEALASFQSSHTICLLTGVPPARAIRCEEKPLTAFERAEKTWALGMQQHFGAEFNAGLAGNRSAA